MNWVAILGIVVTIGFIIIWEIRQRNKERNRLGGGDIY